MGEQLYSSLFLPRAHPKSRKNCAATLADPFPTYLGVMRGLCLASTSMISCTLSLRVVKMMTRLRGAPPAPAS